MSIFTIYLLKTENVSATENLACCEKVKGSDTYCAFVDENLCDNSFNKQVGTQCANTNFCGLGCCWDPSTGEYGRNTNRAACEIKGWSFDASDASCANVPSLQEGCCQLPSGCSYVTQAACRAAITNLPQLNLNDAFRTDIQDEYSCQNLCRSADAGCFVPGDLNANKCTFGFRSEFNEQDGTFREGVYCSNVPICEATKQHSKSCLTPQQAQYFGDDDNVHWLDSLGNPEEVVGSSYTGYVDDVRYDRLCDPNSDNTNKPNCGFCDSIGQSNICGKVELNAGSDYQCVSLDCGAGNGDVFKWIPSNEFDTGWKYSSEGNNNFNIKNGDAWCFYEGVKGEGRDLVGSRDYLFRCKDGEIISETQGDGRSNVCYMSFDENKRPNANFVPNQGAECLSVNNDELEGNGECQQEDEYQRAICNRQKRCEDLGSVCYWNSYVDRCAPMVAPSGSETCKDQGSFEFLYGCGYSLLSGWNCDPIYSKYGKREGYEEGYNNFCRSVGDCGVWYNTEGVKGVGGYNYFKEHFSGDNVVVASGKLYSVDLSNNMQQFSYTYLDGNKSKLYNYWLNLFKDIQNVVKGYDSGDFDGIVHRSYQVALWSLGGAYSIAYIIYAVYLLVYGSAVTLPLTAVASYVFYYLPISLGLGGTLGTIFGTVIPILGIVALATFLINFWSSKQGVAKITYECLPWNAPTNSNSCEKCDDPNNGYDVCTSYKCESLGANCEFVDAGGNAESGVGFCTAKDPEQNPPTISPLTIYDNKQYKPIADGGYNIGGKFGYDEPIVIGVKTNEKALCKISKIRDQEFDAMQWFDNENWQLEHKIELSIVSEDPGLESLDVYGTGDKTYYVSCQDVMDPPNERKNYRVTFEMDETPDVESPRIVKFDPINNAYIPYNNDKTNLYMLVQDRSGVKQCRYSINPGLSFENMENNMTCTNKLVRDSEGISGYECFGQINNIQNNFENTYYMKCQDKLGRANSQDTIYKLKGTVPLVISKSKPEDNQIIYSREIKLEAMTDRGAEQGKAECRYSLTQGFKPIYESMFRFSTTDAVQHNHDLLLNTGNYKMFMQCRDIAGNQDIKEINFTVDTPELFITSLIPANNSIIYSDSFELKATTENGINRNGDSTCYYSLNNQLQGFIPSKNILETQTIHSKNLSLGDGSYKVDILCEDTAGKKDIESINVKVRRQVTPELKRVYKEGTLLTIEVSEPSECKYSDRNFNYDDNAIQKMASGNNGMKHQALMQNVFYIKCKNLNNNNINQEPFIVYP